jgi:putative acetyltransferase
MDHLTGLRIRRSRQDEGLRVVAIWRAAVDATHDFLTPLDRVAIDAEAEAYLLSAPHWVAVDTPGALLAFMALGEARLEALFVDPPHHGKGVGRALVSFAAGLHPMLDTEVNAQNTQAVEFYRALGFGEIGSSQKDDQGRSHPLVRMRVGAPEGEVETDIIT